MIGPPSGRSELILAKFALWSAGVVFKPVGGVEYVVAEELPAAP